MTVKRLLDVLTKCNPEAIVQTYVVSDLALDNSIMELMPIVTIEYDSKVVILSTQEDEVF